MIFEWIEQIRFDKLKVVQILEEILSGVLNSVPVMKYSSVVLLKYSVRTVWIWFTKTVRFEPKR